MAVVGDGRRGLAQAGRNADSNEAGSSEPQGFIKPNGVGIPALQDGGGEALVLFYFHLHVIFLRTYLLHITAIPLAIGNNLMYI